MIDPLELGFTLARRRAKATARANGRVRARTVRIRQPSTTEVLAVLQLVRYAVLLLVVIARFGLPAQPAADTFGLAAGEHSVGFRLLEDEDRSRIVTAGIAGATHPRPIRTYLWYPAATSARAQPLTFGDYATLADDDVWPAAIAGELRTRLRFANGPLARSLSAADLRTLLTRPMRAVEDAGPLPGPFPLLIISLGLYYESPISFAALAEYLAGAGFAVATAPLVGTHVTPVKVDSQDIETQARDLEFVIARARQLAFVDGERLGVIGFDQGGMTGVVLTMRNRDVDAFVSLDSGIQYAHPSGQPRASPHFDPLALRVPWLHAGNSSHDPPHAPDAPSLYDEAIHADRYWLRADAMEHADFTSYGLVEGRGPAPGYWRALTAANLAGHRAVAEYVRHFFGAHMNASEVSMALLDQALRQPPADAGLVLTFHAAAPAPIGYDELVRKLIDGEADAAIAGLRTLTDDTPEHWLLAEETLTRLWVSLFFSWNLAEQALPLAEFAAERYPESANAQAVLRTTQAALGSRR
jgi:dienelactone hydrolase